MNEKIEEMDLAVLNCFRNKYYTDGNSTENGIVANAINDVLPILVLLKNEDFRKQSKGEWEQFGLQNPKCSLCRSYNIEKSRFCPNCGAKMRGTKNDKN